MLPNLVAIDGITVGVDERDRAQECQPEHACSIVKEFSVFKTSLEKENICFISLGKSSPSLSYSSLSSTRFTCSFRFEILRSLQ